MPRDPDNNPTDRIIRLIEEYSAWVEYCSYLLSHFPPAQLPSMSPRPPSTELEKEKLRQHLTKPHSVAVREYKRRMRMLGADHSFAGVQSRRGLLASGVVTGEQPNPLEAKASYRHSILDNAAPLDADAEAMVDALKKGKLSFAQPTREEVMRSISSKSQELAKEEAEKRAELTAKAKSLFNKEEGDA